MATVGRLNALLSADTAAFTNNLNRASRTLSSSAVRMNRSLAVVDRGFKSLGKSAALFAKSQIGLRSLIGLVAGTGGIGLLVKRSLDAADAIGKTADGIGITTAALQEYRFAAQLAGVETATIDGAFQAFGKRLGELKVGTGTLTTFLDKFDRQLKRNILSTRSTDDALNLIFKAMAGVEDQSVKAAFAAAAFGRTAGVRMVNLVRDGADSIDNMRQRARDLGIVLSDNLIRSAEDTNDRLAEFTAQIDTAGSRILLNLSPAILGVTELFATLTSGISATGTALGSAFAPSAQEQLASLEAQLVSLKAAAAAPPRTTLFESSATGLRGVRRGQVVATPGPGTPQRRPGTGGADPIKALERRIAALREIVALESEAAAIPPSPLLTDAGGVVSNSKAFLDFNIKALKIQDQLAASQIDTFGDLETVIGRTAEAARQNLATVFSVIETNQQRYEAEVAFLDKTRDQLEASNQLTAENIAILEKGSAAALKRLAESEESNPALLEKRAILDSVATSEERLVVLEGKLNDAVRRKIITDEQAIEVLRRTKIQMGEVSVAMELQNRTLDLLDSAIAGNINSWQDLGRAALSVLQDIISETLRSQRTLSGGGSSFLDNLTKSGSSILGFLGFAHGGRPPVGQTVVVGEQGPELFVADTPGTILSAEERRRRQRGGDRFGTEVTGTPTAVNVTTPSVEADVLGLALRGFGGPVGSLFSAVRRGVFGTFGVVRGGTDPGQAPPFGSDLFGMETAAGRTARDMESALAGARGLGAIARGLADDTAAGDEFGLSPGHPGFGGGESGTGGAESSGGGGRAGSAGTSSPGGIGGFEHGGRPGIGDPVMVGERGRELFVPDVAGQIIPNAALGGPSITNHFTIDARNAAPGVGQEIDRALQRAVPHIIKSSVNAVVDARRRNPNLFR